MIQIKSLYQPVLVNFPTGGRYVISGSTWIPVNDTTTLSDIKWIPTHKSKNDHFGFHKKEWQVEGSTGNKHTVKYQKGFGWWCGCKGFYYRKKCRHITNIKELNKRS